MKIKVKVNPLLLDKSTVRDTVSGIVFNHNEWVEVDADIWERLKDAKYKQGKTKVFVLIADEEELDDLEKSLKEMQRVSKKYKYICVESYRNEKEKANLLYWQVTCEAFNTPEEWFWWFKKTGYNGDYSFIYFE